MGIIRWLLKGRYQEEKTKEETIFDRLDFRLNGRLRSCGWDTRAWEGPTIVVFGDEHTGKSTFIKRLIGEPVDAPHTKIPVIITCSYNKNRWNARIVPSHEISVICSSHKTFIDTLNTVNNTQKNDSVSIYIEGPNFQPLTVIELPGIISCSSTKKPEEFLKGKNIIPICMISATTTSLRNSSAYSLVQKCGIEDRTIIVCTMIDILNPSHWKDFLVQRLASVQNMYAVVNTFSYSEEQKFFSHDMLQILIHDKQYTPYISTIQSRMGIYRCFDTLTQIIIRSIKAEIRQQVYLHRTSCQERLIEPPSLEYIAENAQSMLSGTRWIVPETIKTYDDLTIDGIHDIVNVNKTFNFDYPIYPNLNSTLSYILSNDCVDFEQLLLLTQRVFEDTIMYAKETPSQQAAIYYSVQCTRQWFEAIEVPKLDSSCLEPYKDKLFTKDPEYDKEQKRLQREINKCEKVLTYLI